MWGVFVCFVAVVVFFSSDKKNPGARSIGFSLVSQGCQGWELRAEIFLGFALYSQAATTVLTITSVFGQNKKSQMLKMVEPPSGTGFHLCFLVSAHHMASPSYDHSLTKHRI